MTSASVTVHIDGLSYHLDVSGEDYEGADPTVGLQGGFCGFTLDSAEDNDGNTLDDEACRVLSDRIALSDAATEKVLSALNDAIGEGHWEDFE